MLNSRTRSAATRLLAATLLSTTFVGNASAEDARVKDMKFELVVPWKSSINVTSSDGQKWDTILPDQVTVWAYMHVDTAWPGYVEQVGIFLGQCNNTQCGGLPRIFDDVVLKRDYNHQTYIKFSASEIPVSSSTGIATVPYGDLILNTCNAHLQPDGATKLYSFSRTMTASFSANTRKALGEIGMYPPEVGTGFNGGDHTMQAEFSVPVNCLPSPKPATEPPPRPHRHKIEVEEIKLFLTTYVTATSQGVGQCKPLKVTTRIGTDKAGPVKVMLWRKIDNGPVTDEVKTLEAKDLGGGEFGADWNKWENFGKTTYAQYMAEIIGGTFAPSTPWKDITIHCNENLADAPRQNTAQPTDKAPKRIGLIDPPRTSIPPRLTTDPKISCVGGKVKHNDCICPRGTKEFHTGANAYRCVPTVGNYKKVEPMRPQRSSFVAPHNQRVTTGAFGRRMIR